MVMKEETMSTERIYNGRVLNLRIDTVELPDMKYGKREIIEHNGGVAIIALDEQKNILMVKQFRKAIEDVLLELPAGKLEAKEDPLECAKRELEEETGYKTENIELITSFYTSPGFSNEKLYIYLAKDLKKGTVNLDEGEFLESYKYKAQEVYKMIEENKIEDGKTILGLMMVKAEILGE